MAQETKPYWGDKHQPFVKIGTGQQELRTLADAVVHGASIAHAEIADLRALIEAVQSHSDVNLAPSKGDDKKADRDQHAPTSLAIHGGRVAPCDRSRLDIRVTLSASASFSPRASFRAASFSSGAYFGAASFAGGADFRKASYSGDVDFTPTSFVGDVWLDARWIDVRTVRFADSARRGAIKRWMRRRFGWTVVRGVGELGILTRVSLIALIAVPILAGLWPALRVAVNRYNRAMTEASEQFDQAADRLETAAENTDPALSVTIGEFGAWAHDWRDRFGEMTMDQPQLSWTLALAFFAAVGVTIGQLLYQVNAPIKLRKEDEDEFVESIHKRYPEGAPDRNDGPRRAIDALAAIARIRDDRHASFVDHHGETVWIPPGTRIHWFSDLKDEVDVDETQVEADDPDGSQVPKKGRAASVEGIIPGAERARIALEEGARAEYWLTGRERPFWAWMSFVFYCVAMSLLLWILIIQSHHVAKAAGWW